MVAVISGGTKGIGKAVSEIFLAHGFDISICARNEKDLKSLKTEWGKKFPQQNVHTMPVDMGNKKKVNQYADAVLKEYESVDVLVNNAGAFIPGQIISEDDGVMESLVEVNLYSAYYLSRALIKPMIEKRKGHIFNMCSIASFMAYPNGGSYAISKFALLGFSKCLRAEVKEHQIKVTAIMPGATWSASWEGVDLPEDRLMKADDIAKTIWAAYNLSESAVVEEVIIRPQLGDL